MAVGGNIIGRVKRLSRTAAARPSSRMTPFAAMTPRKKQTRVAKKPVRRVMNRGLQSKEPSVSSNSFISHIF